MGIPCTPAVGTRRRTLVGAQGQKACAQGVALRTATRDPVPQTSEEAITARTGATHSISSKASSHMYPIHRFGISQHRARPYKHAHDPTTYAAPRLVMETRSTWSRATRTRDPVWAPPAQLFQTPPFKRPLEYRRAPFGKPPGPRPARTAARAPLTYVLAVGPWSYRYLGALWRFIPKSAFTDWVSY